MKIIFSKKILAILFIIFSVCIKMQAQQAFSIAAAADLRFAMDSIVTVFKQANPDVTITTTYGSSGQFFQQISNGAPFDLFFSADTSYPQQLKAKNFTISDTKIYGTGQIVIWSKKTDPSKAQMNSLLDASVSKISIANPQHAPYGMRAQESLQYYKMYETVKDKLVFGENISQAAQYITSGAADIGIIALSLALSPNMQNRGGKYWLIPEKSHQKLIQGFVILKHAEGNMAGQKFSAFVISRQAKNIFNHFGIGN